MKLPLQVNRRNYRKHLPQAIPYRRDTPKKNRITTEWNRVQQPVFSNDFISSAALTLNSRLSCFAAPLLFHRKLLPHFVLRLKKNLYQLFQPVCLLKNNVLPTEANHQATISPGVDTATSKFSFPERASSGSTSTNIRNIGGGLSQPAQAGKITRYNFHKMNGIQIHIIPCRIHCPRNINRVAAGAFCLFSVRIIGNGECHSP